MLNFNNIEELVSHMFTKLEGDEPVSVVANKDLAVAVMKELLDYDNVILNFANVDTYDYDKEYIVSLYDATDTDYWYVDIEQIYDYEKDIYLGADGYVLFHEDVNSKALVDMQNNEFIPLEDHDWFVIGEDEEADDIENDNEEEVAVSAINDKAVKAAVKPSVASKESYRVNGKDVTKEEYEKALSDIEDKYLEGMRDILLNYAEFMDECNEWRKMLHW